MVVSPGLVEATYRGFLTTLPADVRVTFVIPKGREGAHDYLRGFVEEVRKNGLLGQAVKQSGLRGTIPPE